MNIKVYKHIKLCIVHAVGRRSVDRLQVYNIIILLCARALIYEQVSFIITFWLLCTYYII